MRHSLRHARAVLLLLGLGAGSAGAAVAGGVSPMLMQQLHWRSIGPFRGGRVLAVAGAPDDREKFYFGAVNGGVWRTDDAGRTWAPIFDDQPVASIGALAVAPSAPSVLYVGTGEADMRSDIAQGRGMFRSDDAGAHWSAIGLADTQQIGRILVDPRDARTVLVAALGHPYGPNDERGVFRSEDGGEHWTKTLFRNADTGAIDMAYQPDNPDVVYAALWQTRRPPWSVYPPSSGPGSGLYRSTDGGRTWAQLNGHGLPQSPARIGIATTPASPARVFALIDTRDGKDAGLYRSDDAGGTWRLVSADKRIVERAWYFSGITADPKNADVVHVCDTIMLRSDDGGAHFVPTKGDPTGDDFHALWIDPNNTQRQILGVDQGALVTVNGGRSWSSWFNQPTGQFYHVATDSRFPYRVYGAQQDSGAADVPSRSDNPFDGVGMGEFHESAAGGESDNIAPDPDDPDTVYGGRVDRLDRRSGQIRSVDPVLAFPDNYRATWTLPLVWGPDHTLYFGNQRVFRTQDGGAHWQPISEDLTRPDPDVPATLDAATAADRPESGKRRGVVYAIGPSPIEKSLVWAGTDDGRLWRTRDGGAHWDEVTPQGLQAWSKIGVVEPSHFDADTAYIAIDRHRLDDPSPYVMRTVDGGRSWTPIVAGLDAPGYPASVNVVREDAVRRGLLYAGTEHGAYVSFDDGAHWQELQAGLPRTSVRDIVVHGNDLVLATHGRGFYVLDDIAALRALAADASPGPRLYPLADAVRVHPPAFTGTPMPHDEPVAIDPPRGAAIDFSVGEAPAKLLELAITDAQGSLVRRYRSDDPAPAPDFAKIDSAPEWLDHTRPPPTAPGAHRFVWDLLYARPQALSGLHPEASGVWAPPGSYTVTLTVDGHAFRETLRVQPDPRVKLGLDDLAQQFTLARAIEAARVEAHTALGDAAKLRAAWAVEPGQPHRDALTRLDTLVAAAPDDARAAAGAPPARVGGLSDVATRLDTLAQDVEAADAAPTPDAQSGFAQARDALKAALATWSSLRAS